MVLASDYPAASHLYGDVFVHTRVKEYQKTTTVRVVSFLRNWENYIYEGVKVVHAPEITDLERLYSEFRPDSVFIHFYNRKLFDFVTQIDVPVVIWVHGYEALGWYRRHFNYTIYQMVRHSHNIIIPNVKQMIGFRKIVKFSNRNPRVKFVFVSEWMKNTASVDAACKIRNSEIIPNPINVHLFKFNNKSEAHRKNILMIRSFESRKYANDIAVKAILLLSSKSFFSDLNFSIYGKGKYFKVLTLPLTRFKNVSLYETFLPNQDIPDVHQEHGVFLCPTRQDAQGVSMCEAMASGLVPVTSRNTAIPEFVEHLRTGMLSSSVQELADAIERMYMKPADFLRISKNASESIAQKCSIDRIINKELSI